MAVFAGILGLVLAIIASASFSYLKRTCPIDPIVIQLEPAPKAEGFWSHEFNLGGVEKLLVGKGPEDLAFDSQGRLYTAVGDGWIKRIEADGKVENHTYVGGRPLGIAFGPGEELYVVEPSQGLLKIANDGVVHHLSNAVDGLSFRLADGVVVRKDGTVYFTDASSKFGMDKVFLDTLEGRPNGRFLKYDPSTNSASVLIKDMVFPNGVALSENEDFVLIAETSRARLLRYWLKGDKEGIVDVFMEGLPGFPDNVRLGDDGNFYVGLVADRTMIVDWLFRTPLVRCGLAHESIFKMVSNERSIARLIVVSAEGKLLYKYEDPTGKVIGYVTGGSKQGDFVYFSGLGGNFIGRLKL